MKAAVVAGSIGASLKGVRSADTRTRNRVSPQPIDVLTLHVDFQPASICRGRNHVALTRSGRLDHLEDVGGIITAPVPIEEDRRVHTRILDRRSERGVTTATERGEPRLRPA